MSHRRAPSRRVGGIPCGPIGDGRSVPVLPGGREIPVGNWDLTSCFPAFDGPETRSFARQLEAGNGGLLGAAGWLPTLDAAGAADREALPRRILRLKARPMQAPGVAYQDLEARLPGALIA